MMVALSAAPPDEPPDGTDACAAQLVECKANLAKLLKMAADRMTAEMVARVQTLLNDGSTADAAAFGSSVEAVFKGLSRSLVDMVSELSDGHTRIGRESVKAAKTTFHMKLAHARTASGVQLQNQATELEATFHRRIEETLSAAKGEGSAELVAAHKELEEVKQELAALRMKHDGTENVLTQTKAMLRSAEDAGTRARTDVERVESEMARSKEILEKALADLDVKVKENQSIEETVKELVQQSEQQAVALNEARTAMETLLHDLGIAIEEKTTLGQQIQALVTQVHQRATCPHLPPCFYPRALLIAHLLIHSYLLASLSSPPTLLLSFCCPPVARPSPSMG